MTYYLELCVNPCGTPLAYLQVRTKNLPPPAQLKLQGRKSKTEVNGMNKFDSILDLIRHSTLIQLRPREISSEGASLWGQLELQLPGGMKDRVALQIVEDAERSGELRPGSVIIESSSGSTAEGLARVGAAKGYKVIIVTDPRLDEITKAKLLALGAELEIVDRLDPVTGWQGTRLQRLREIMEKHPRAFWACQYDTPSNPAAYDRVGRAIYEGLGGKVAALVGTVGTGGSLCGIGRSLRKYVSGVKIVAVDAVGSVLFNQPNGKRLQSGHGNSLLPGNVNYPLIDEVHWVSDGEAFNGCLELVRRTGVFAGGSSGATYVVASWVAEHYDKDEQVVAILPDRGDRYYANIYSPEFMREKGLSYEVAGSYPTPIRYGVDVAKRWSYAPIPHAQPAAYTGDVSTTEEFARDLGLEAAYVS
ncbi:MAG TPA: cysteine synthase family protein [Candidatus Angelobacter sp.]|jgi:cysteine synthase A|nr:cysteine synthase family protein [Candidatus Angelobacter sp.]